MTYPVLTYSRDLGDFGHDLAQLHQCGLKALRLIYKGKSEADFNLRIREIQEKIIEHNIELNILIDLPGSKPIVGDLGKGLDVQSGHEYHLAGPASHPSSSVIPTVSFFSHNSFPVLTAGDVISIADDELNLLVEGVAETVACKALNSFHLTSGRSMSVKNKPFAFEANSERDLHFVQNLKHGGVKLLVSFTKKADDIRRLKILQPGIDVIPKIETILDDTTLLEIMDQCQTLMLGRGDLSASSHPYELFAFQERLIDLCRIHNKRLIIGTGLLAGICDTGAPSISEVMDYGYLRSRKVDAFLIAGSNAHKKPMETLQFMKAFEK